MKQFLDWFHSRRKKRWALIVVVVLLVVVIGLIELQTFRAVGAFSPRGRIWEPSERPRRAPSRSTRPTLGAL
jgi:hypothetical protein